jgi:hypothetical protein
MSMALANSNKTTIFGGNISLAFDSDQKESCEMLAVLGKVRSLQWAECTHRELSEVQKPVKNKPA